PGTALDNAIRAGASSELAGRGISHAVGSNPRSAGVNDTADDIDLARAQEYALLATLLARSPDTALLDRLAQLKVDASPLGLAHAALAEAAQAAKVEQVEREFFNLFIGLGRGELLPYASYYLAGF